MPSTARGWFVLRFGNGATFSPFIINQEILQNHFDTQLHTILHLVTRRIFKKGIWRVGKLMWVASTPTAANAHRFNHWNKTSRSTAAEQNLQINCWEAVLYLAYQCDAINKTKCINFYRLPAANDGKIRALFGDATLFAGANIPNMGDILSFEDHASQQINHIALYAGLFGGQHYIFHNLSYNAATTGIQMGGGFHFESLISVRGRYQDNVDVYFTQPFWEAAAPTNTYFNTL